MKKQDLAGHVGLVTGASSGIGAAIARDIVVRGGGVVMLGRRVDRLESLAAELGDRALAIQGDVTVDGDVSRAIAVGRGRFGAVDLVFANAGFGVAGTVAELRLEDYQRQFDTNVFGAIRTVQEAMAELEASRGRIGLVGSVNGYVSIPGWSAYCMSKHALRSLAECLRLELLPRGVSVTHLAPGFVESEFRRVDNHAKLHEKARDPMPGWLVESAPRAARSMVDAVLARRAEAVITAHGKLAVGVQRHAPKVVSTALRFGAGVAGRLSKRPS